MHEPVLCDDSIGVAVLTKVFKINDFAILLNPNLTLKPHMRVTVGNAFSMLDFLEASLCGVYKREKFHESLQSQISS